MQSCDASVVSPRGSVGHVRRESGQILLLTALSLTALLGLSALALDASFMYDKRNRLYAAADAAAKSAAAEVRRNPSVTNASLQTFANQQVTAHGFNPAGTTSVVVNHPPASGPYAGNAGFVEAIVSEPTSTFFGVVLGWTTMTPGARAVAGTGPGPNCLIALGPATNVPPTMSVGNSTINMPNCGVANGGNLVTTNPNADINAQSIGVTGSCLGSGCGNMSNMTTGSPPPADPLENELTPPANPGGCTTASGGTLNLTPGCYSAITANTALNLASGLYYITGPITIGNNVTITGSGVTLYLTGAGRLTIANHPTINLSAPTSGPYAGIAFYQDPTNLNAVALGNNGTLNLSGVFYAPGADVTVGNSFGGTTDCVVFVVNSLTIPNGNGSFASTCAAYGGSPLHTVTVAE